MHSFPAVLFFFWKYYFVFVCVLNIEYFGFVSFLSVGYLFERLIDACLFRSFTIENISSRTHKLGSSAKFTLKNK